MLNEDTFEEQLSYKLSRLNVFLLVGFLVILLMTLTIMVISFTSFREYIPGYDSTELRRQAIENTYRLDSLQAELLTNQRFISSISQVLSGDMKPSSFQSDSVQRSIRLDLSEINFSTNTQDSILRAEVAREDKFNLLESASTKVNFVLFPPVTGTLTQRYDARIEHFAVDVVVPKDTPVKAVATGTVIFADWTTETGYVVIIDHPYNLTSVYKHNESISVKQGDKVSSGGVIATVGSTGILSTGPHLHFELWSDGYPVNPTEFIDFE